VVKGEGGSARMKRERKRGEVAQIMYTHVSKCKNNKIKFEKRKGRVLGTKRTILCLVVVWIP
jgi:hypothetical protein